MKVATDLSHSKWSNSAWQTHYNTRYVPDVGDLFLIADAVSYDIQVSLPELQMAQIGYPKESVDPRNLSDANPWLLQVPDATSTVPWTAIDWPVNLSETKLNINHSVYFGNFTTSIVTAGTERAVLPLNSTLGGLPQLAWPQPQLISPSSNETWKPNFNISTNAGLDSSLSDAITILSNGNDVSVKSHWASGSWMGSPPLHISGAYSVPVDDGSFIQIALVYMIIVVFCNGCKVVAIWMTLRGDLRNQILTQGDAIASFLDREDRITLGYSACEKKTILSAIKRPNGINLKQWEQREYPCGALVKSRWRSMIFL
jgi:hypothetical protein